MSELTTTVPTPERRIRRPPARWSAPPRAGRVLLFARVLLGRLLVFVSTLCGAVLVVQVLLWAAPGDPIDMLPNSEELRPILEKEWQLDRPLPVRFAGYLGRAAQGDLGTSLTYRPGTAVADVIAVPATRSMGWLAAALALTMVWSTGLAWATAGRRSVTRKLIQVVSVAPVFLLAHVAVNTANEAAWYGMNAGWIGRPDWFALPAEPSPLRATLAVVLLAVGSGALAEVRTEIENTLLRIRSSGYVMAARALGAPTWPHVLLNLVGPLTIIASSRTAFFVGGLVILEKVLLLNGVGSILWQAADMRDYPLAMGITAVLAAVVCGARLVGDLVRISVDPRLSSEWTT